jgi:predicted RNA-binding protein with PUA domain
VFVEPALPFSGAWFLNLKLRIVRVISNRIPGFRDHNYVVTDADGEIMYAYKFEHEALDVIRKWA